ncbi:MAG: glycerol-3-phosphate 1-O-acyltransferase PlsY, partial [Planctomycetales bacterium]
IHGRDAPCVFPSRADNFKRRRNRFGFPPIAASFLGKSTRARKHVLVPGRQAMMIPTTILFVAAGYLIGSIPFGYLAGRLVAGVDIREVGSGNVGATNVGRTIGWKWFVVVLICDFLKGLIPALAGGMLASQFPLLVGSIPAVALSVLGGVAAVLGHLWPVWLRFKGGKGVATGLGVIAALAPSVGWPPLLAAVAVFAVVLGASRFMSLASISAACVYGAVQLAMLSEPLSAQASVTCFSLLVPGLVVWRHRENIVRLWKGEESKIGRGKPADSEPMDSKSPDSKPPDSKSEA